MFSFQTFGWCVKRGAWWEGLPSPGATKGGRGARGDRGGGRGGGSGTGVVIRGWFLVMIVLYNYVMFEHLG